MGSERTPYESSLVPLREPMRYHTIDCTAEETRPLPTTVYQPGYRGTGIRKSDGDIGNQVHRPGVSTRISARVSETRDR